MSHLHSNLKASGIDSKFFASTKLSLDIYFEDSYAIPRNEERTNSSLN